MIGAIQADARGCKPYRVVSEVDVLQASHHYAILSMVTMADDDEEFCREKGLQLPLGSLRDLAEVQF